VSTTALPSLSSGRLGSGTGRRLRTLARGRAEDPAWVRPALLGIIAVAAALCLWDLTISGYANTYYSAAAKSASESWKAWFFGSLDPGSFITVDKPPLATWLMGLFVRTLGFSSFSILLPEALCTIASVGLLYATVRRAAGYRAALIAAGILALTPVSVLMGRINNPDALLVLLFVAAAYLVQRAIESGATKHLVLAGAVVGLAFMTKLLAGWMIVPALSAAYLLAGPPRLAMRIRQLAIAGATMVAVSVAWPVAAWLWPGSTPYIGGSTDGSIRNLILGYDGFGRLTGSSGGTVTTFGGSPGLLRMFNEQVGGQVAWLIPLAGIGLVTGLWVLRRKPRTDLRRAALVLFGVWALAMTVVFSSQRGIFHNYYVSALAPAIAALAGIGFVMLVRWARHSLTGLVALDMGIAASAWLAIDLLARTPSFVPWLRAVIGVAAIVAIAANMALRMPRLRGRARLTVAAVAASVAVLAGPTAYSLATVGNAYSGGSFTAGPASASVGGRAGPGAGGMARGMSLPGGGRPGGGGPGVGGGAPNVAPMKLSSQAIAYLEANQGSTKYLVAGDGSMTTAPLIIETGRAVMTIGGFNGSDPTPTVSELAAMVDKGELKYVLVSASGGGGPGGAGNQQAINRWVRAHATAVGGLSIRGGTLYRVR
jgi:4-amino-4-deoxy-L-arabinose transferase-like glycosyltransferase